MHVVNVIATILMLLVLVMTYLLLHEDTLSSFLKLLFNIWFTFISTECWIRYVHKSARNGIELWRHWCCLTLLGTFMCASKYWEMTEQDLRESTVYAFGYYFVRLVMLVDFKDNNLDEENDDADSAIVIAYRLVIQDLIQELQDQQEFQETMND